MLIFFIILQSLVLTSADLDFQYCSNEENTCEPLTREFAGSNQERFLFYSVNPPEGFNLRRDVYMRFAIMLVEAQKEDKRKNWRLVLPPWYRLYHWRSLTSYAQPIPWSAYFDINSLKSYAPVVELCEVIEKIPVKKKKHEVDVVYVLQNYDDPFEGGTFVEKWEINEQGCHYDGKFWGYNNITTQEVICVRFQGKISKLWELIDLHPFSKAIMFAHGEIPLHETYGTKTYWECRKSMRFSSELDTEADKYLRNHLDCRTTKCSTYISVHWRRQDFAISRKHDIPSLTGTAEQINNYIKRSCPKIIKVFIASDASHKELIALERQLVALGYQVYINLPSKSVIEKFKDGGLAIIEQIICSRAAHFIGTHESTFTFRIQEEREILGFDAKTTFNRLCPDHGDCVKMSRWTITD